jgi:hypothetical protein
MLAVFAALAAACSSPKLWAARSTPGCHASTGDPALDRERTYLATLVALNQRGYAILRAEPAREIEADFVSDYKPEVSHTRWLLRVQSDASLSVDTPPSQRHMHQRSERWYSGLIQSVRGFQCRDLNWLRWEAQNRGLIPIGAVAQAPGTAAESSGGELPQSSAVGNPHAQRLTALERERAALHVGRSIALSAVGAGFGIFTISVVSQGAAYALQGCSANELGSYPTHDCSTRDAGRILLWTGAATGVVAGTLLAVGLPLMLGRLRKARALGREIKILRKATLSLAADSAGFGVSLRAPF